MLSLVWDCINLQMFLCRSWFQTCTQIILTVFRLSLLREVAPVNFHALEKVSKCTKCDGLQLCWKCGRTMKCDVDHEMFSPHDWKVAVQAGPVAPGNYHDGFQAQFETQLVYLQTNHQGNPSVWVWL